jgi:hypothetical protein
MKNFLNSVTPSQTTYNNDLYAGFALCQLATDSKGKVVVNPNKQQLEDLGFKQKDGVELSYRDQNGNTVIHIYMKYNPDYNLGNEVVLADKVFKFTTTIKNEKDITKDGSKVKYVDDKGNSGYLPNVDKTAKELLIEAKAANPENVYLAETDENTVRFALKGEVKLLANLANMSFRVETDSKGDGKIVYDKAIVLSTKKSNVEVIKNIANGNMKELEEFLNRIRLTKETKEPFLFNVLTTVNEYDGKFNQKYHDSVGFEPGVVGINVKKDGSYGYRLFGKTLEKYVKAVNDSDYINLKGGKEMFDFRVVTPVVSNNVQTTSNTTDESTDESNDDLPF